MRERETASSLKSVTCLRKASSAQQLVFFISPLMWPQSLDMTSNRALQWSIKQLPNWAACFPNNFRPAVRETHTDSERQRETDRQRVKRGRLVNLCLGRERRRGLEDGDNTAVARPGQRRASQRVQHATSIRPHLSYNGVWDIQARRTLEAELTKGDSVATHLHLGVTNQILHNVLEVRPCCTILLVVELRYYPPSNPKMSFKKKTSHLWADCFQGILENVSGCDWV